MQTATIKDLEYTEEINVKTKKKNIARDKEGNFIEEKGSNP